MKIAIVMKQDLSIASWYESDAARQGGYGGPWGDASQSAHVELASGDSRVMKAVQNGEAIELEVDEDLEAALAAQQMSELRAERDRRLSACDWTQLSDSPLAVQAKSDWADHRQALRDLPENTVDASNPSWPSEPA